MKVSVSVFVLFSSFISLTPLSLAQDLRTEFKSAARCNFETAQFQSDPQTERLYLDNAGYPYAVTSRNNECTKMPFGRLGYIITERTNTCFAGYNRVCANNYIDNKTQLSLEGSELVVYFKIGETTPVRKWLARLRPGFVVR